MKDAGVIVSLSIETFKEEDLVDGLVVDKEGYICGYVANFRVEPDHIIINLYTYDTQRVQTLNEEELVQRLLAHLPQEKSRSRFSFSSRRKPSHEALYDQVKQTLNLPLSEPVSLENLVDYATTEGIEIPYQIQELTMKTEKGSINWSYVDKIAFSDVGKCLLLNDAVEAKNRKISLSDEIGFKSTEDLVDRIVLDSDAKIVGSAVKLLVGLPPGILITLERLIPVEQSDPEALKMALVPTTFIDVQQLFDQVKNDLGLKNPTDDDLLTWARRTKIDVPNKVIERREVVMELTLGWDQIAKIGDVVILKKSIESLIEESKRSNLPDLNRGRSNPRKR
jgi:hypothetical protein